jgi:hypothetical protein
MSFKTFTEQEVIDTYNKFVKKENSYFQKLSPFPLHLNNKRWKWEGHDFPRIACLLDFQEWVVKHNINPLNNVLCTASDDPELEFLNINNLDYKPYENENNDFHTLNLPRTDYDFILFSQTIEHLYNPFLSMWNLYHHMNEGGMMFTSMPTINIPHMLPFHYNGFTPLGLCMLMKSVGFEVLELGYWGNYDYISKLFKNHNWPSYQELIDEKGNIPNEPKNQVQCWILVKK